MSSKRDDHFRINERYLAFQVRATRGYLVRFRIPVPRRAALDNAGYIHVLPMEWDFGQECVQELSGSTYER